MFLCFLCDFHHSLNSCQSKLTDLRRLQKQSASRPASCHVTSDFVQVVKNQEIASPLRGVSTVGITGPVWEARDNFCGDRRPRKEKQRVNRALPVIRVRMNEGCCLTSFPSLLKHADSPREKERPFPVVSTLHFSDSHSPP